MRGVGLLANERTNQKCCEYFSTKALKCGTRSSVANPSSPLPQNSPLTSYLVLPLQPNGMSCTCASMPTNYHAYTRASCTPSYILPHTYAATVCSGMCELWARSSFQAHPGTPPVGGGATRDRYPSVHACLTRFETLPNYITTTRGKSRQKGYPKSLSLCPLFPSLTLPFHLCLKRLCWDSRFASSVYFVAGDIDYCKPNLVARFNFLSVFHYRW